MERRKNLGIAALIVTLSLAGLVIFKSGDESPVRVSTDEPLEGEVLVEGYIECLPLKVGKSLSERYCVKGIVGSDGKYYALDTTRVGRRERLMDEGQAVKAIGTFEPADRDSEEAQIFEYSGVLTVRVLE